MLYLERKSGEEIAMGDKIRIKIMGVSKSGSVTLGFEAPIDVPIDRLEIHEKKISNPHEVKQKSRGPKVIYKRSKLAA